MKKPVLQALYQATGNCPGTSVTEAPFPNSGKSYDCISLNRHDGVACHPGSQACY